MPRPHRPRAPFAAARRAPVPWAAAGLALLLSTGLAAEPATWRIDPVHTRVLFEVEHLGLAWSLATASGPQGRLVVDPEGWEGAQVEVAIPIDRIDFGDADWNAAMRGRRWFDAERHPVARFRSTAVDAIDASTARVHGELELAGRVAPVVLEVRRNGARRNPLTLRRTVGFSAHATLDRRDFGLDGSPTLIGHEVRVRIELEAVRGSARADATPGPASPGAAPDTDPATDTPPTEADDADPQHD